MHCGDALMTLDAESILWPDSAAMALLYMPIHLSRFENVSGACAQVAGEVLRGPHFMASQRESLSWSRPRGCPVRIGAGVAPLFAAYFLWVCLGPSTVTE